MTRDVRRIDAVATGQFGTVTYAQLMAAGVSRAELRRRIQSGVLQQIGPHTFRSPMMPTEHLDDLAALLLDCGPDAVASGPTAAALHSLDGFDLGPPFHVTIRRGRNVQRARHRIHTTVWLPATDRRRVRGVDCMTATRTLIDLARHCTTEQLTVAVDSALRDRLTTELALHRRIAKLRERGRHGIPKLIAVLDGCDAGRGGHSWLERRYLELVTADGLPKPVTQAVLARAGDRSVRVDCHFAGTPVVVELLGYHWHRTEAQMSRDAERLNALAVRGYVPLQFTYRQVTTAPRQVMRATKDALLPHLRG